MPRFKRGYFTCQRKRPKWNIGRACFPQLVNWFCEETFPPEAFCGRWHGTTEHFPAFLISVPDSLIADPCSLIPDLAFYPDSDPRVLMTKNWEKFTAEPLFLHFFRTKNCNLHILLKDFLATEEAFRNHENIQHFKTWNFLTFFYFCGSFLPSWIRIHWPNWIWIRNTVPPRKLVKVYNWRIRSPYIWLCFTV